MEFTPYLRPACLNSEFQIEVPNAHSVSWNNDLGDGSNSVRKQDYTLTPHDVCSSKFEQFRKLPHGINETQQLCAQLKESDKDLDIRNSGSPLQNYHPSSYCMYNLIGVSSFGTLAAQNNPSVFTRISTYADWIEDNAFVHE